MSDYGHQSLSSSPLRIGTNVLIRTVTYFWIGKVVQISEKECVLCDASWVADTGRYSVALATGELSEVETIPPDATVSVNMAAIIDVVPWNHSLPKESK